ncbi:MAG: hypothetical protein JNK90_29480 [Planctomycetaceae bacterium]|nr:hypothetical protein [Planctomycetaceae bacterium]
MIRVLLEIDSEIIAEVSWRDNENILCQSDKETFPILSGVDTCSYSVFNQDEMPALLKELFCLLPKCSNVSIAIDLARRCQESPGTVLTFTAFDE